MLTSCIVDLRLIGIDEPENGVSHKPEGQEEVKGGVGVAIGTSNDGRSDEGADEARSFADGIEEGKEHEDLGSGDDLGDHGDCEYPSAG